MNFIKSIWTKEDYQEYVKYLVSLKNEKNKLFSEKLISTKYEILGLKIPNQREIAKEISKGNIKSFLSFNEYRYHEEVMIALFVLAYSKDINLLNEYLDKYISYIDNWSLCDSFTSSLKYLRNNEDYFNKFKDYSKSSDEYKVRFAITSILFIYIDDKHTDEIFNIIDQVNIDKYYVNMAISWLLCELFIKQRNKTIKYIKHTKINDFTFNKFISKCCDSYRVSKSDKEFLKTLKK